MVGQAPPSRVACRMLIREYSSACEGREVMEVDVDRGKVIRDQLLGML